MTLFIQLVSHLMTIKCMNATRSCIKLSVTMEAKNGISFFQLFFFFFDAIFLRSQVNYFIILRK